VAKPANSDSVKINQKLLDSLKAEAERQLTRNYKWLEIDARTLKALIMEVERGRLVDLRFERPTEPALRD
jgi:hypothetical protein